MRTIRRFMLVEAASLITAALVHFGVLFEGYRHQRAGTAESVIAAVLLAGLLLSWLRPAWTRPAGLLAQGFALLGVAVGGFTIAVGVGPRTVPDVVYHLLLALTLIAGLVMAARSRGREA